MKNASLTILAAVVLASPVSAADGLHPIAAEVQSKLADPDQPFVMVVELTVGDGGGKPLIEAIGTATRRTVKEPGNLDYRLSRNVEDPNEFVLYERWSNIAALDSHLKQPYLTKLLNAFEGLLSEPPEVEVHVPIVFE